MTTYCVRVRWSNSGRESVETFDSLLGRTLFLISMGFQVEVIEEWIGTDEHAV